MEYNQVDLSLGRAVLWVKSFKDTVTRTELGLGLEYGAQQIILERGNYNLGGSGDVDILMPRVVVRWLMDHQRK